MRMWTAGQQSDEQALHEVVLADDDLAQLVLHLAQSQGFALHVVCQTIEIGFHGDTFLLSEPRWRLGEVESEVRYECKASAREWRPQRLLSRTRQPTRVPLWRHYGAKAPIFDNAIGMSARRLKKELGQHFLTRPELCRPLVEFLRPAERLVVEIGPGAGTLTSALLAAKSRVLAWELDPSWAFEVARRHVGAHLSTVVADAVELPWERLPEGTRVAGNLPYNVATRLVLDLLESTLVAPGRIDRAGFLVQREVAERLVAGSGDPGYGSLSVLVAALADRSRLGDVAPGAFKPPPKVWSAFVGLVPRPGPVAPAEYDRFKRLVRAAFSLRRKTLRNALASVFGRARADALVEIAGLEASVRAEALDLDAFVELARHLD